jgi:hypothetical protein
MGIQLNTHKSTHDAEDVKQKIPGRLSDSNGEILYARA